MLHLVAGILFFLLSPGVLLTIPAGSKGLFASGQTSVIAAAVHATLFVAAAYLLTGVVEGFYMGMGVNSFLSNAVAKYEKVKQEIAKQQLEEARINGDRMCQKALNNNYPIKNAVCLTDANNRTLGMCNAGKCVLNPK